MKNKIVLLLSFSLSIIFLISCGGGQKENVQEANLNLNFFDLHLEPKLLIIYERVLLNLSSYSILKNNFKQ